MADEYQAGKMILSQISLFNEAVNLFGDVVEPAMLHAIDECIEEFAKAEQWVGTFELGGDDCDCQLAPTQWNVGEDNTNLDLKAWFAIDNINDGDDYWTALFCNQGRAGGEAGFMFGTDKGTFGKKMAWNKFFSKIDQATISDIKKLGFKIVENDEGKKTFFLPVHLDAAILAEIWGNDGDFSAVDSCFEPVKIALEKIKRAWPIFDAILKNYPVKL